MSKILEHESAVLAREKAYNAYVIARKRYLKASKEAVKKCLAARAEWAAEGVKPPRQ